jgi:methylmalonyl-CoA decarboxylase subunit alpha
VTRQEVSFEELGGAEVHGRRSGVAHVSATTIARSCGRCASCWRTCPSRRASCRRCVPRATPRRETPELNDLVHPDQRRAYPMLDVVRAVVDERRLFEVQPGFARNVITAFAHLGGRSVGVVANDPSVLAGTLDIDASDKAARFIRTCDAFNVPIVTFVDVTGFMPGTAQEHGGIIRHGAKMLFAYAEATVPSSP